MFVLIQRYCDDDESGFSSLRIALFWMFIEILPYQTLENNLKIVHRRFFCEAILPFCRLSGRIISDSVTHRRHHHRLKAVNVISKLNYGEGIARLLAAKLQVAHAHIADAL